MPQLRVDIGVIDQEDKHSLLFNLFNGMRIIFSPGLGNILGYNEREDVINVYGIPDTVITLHDTYNTDVNCQSLFVYCDILERVIVGDTNQPLYSVHSPFRENTGI